MREHEIAKIHVSVNSSATHIRAGVYRAVELFRVLKPRNMRYVYEDILICCGFSIAELWSRKRRSFEKAAGFYKILSSTELCKFRKYRVRNGDT